MTGVVVTAHVRDAAKWERGFRAHADLFKRINTSSIHYTITKNNNVAIYSKTNDVDTYRNFTQSPDVAQAMEEDRMERDTLKVFALKKKLPSA